MQYNTGSKFHTWAAIILFFVSVLFGITAFTGNRNWAIGGFIIFLAQSILNFIQIKHPFTHEQ